MQCLSWPFGRLAIFPTASKGPQLRPQCHGFQPSTGCGDEEWNLATDTILTDFKKEQWGTVLRRNWFIICSYDLLIFLALLLTLGPVAPSTLITLQTGEQWLDGPRHLFGTLPAKVGAFPELAEQRFGHGLPAGSCYIVILCYSIFQYLVEIVPAFLLIRHIRKRQDLESADCSMFWTVHDGDILNDGAPCQQKHVFAPSHDLPSLTYAFHFDLN